MEILTSAYSAVRDAARLLVDRHGSYLMKISTEDEALDHDTVKRRCDALRDVISVELKIGGPGARGDLALVKTLGLEYVIVPMIESPYAMQDFAAGYREIFGGGTPVHAGINIETKTAARYLAAILAKGADILKQVTVGRSDLSKSMNRAVDHATVTAIARRVVAAGARRGLVTSVGGGIDPENVVAVASKIRPRCVNTRNFAFRLSVLDTPEKQQAAICDALAAEILLCRVGDTTLSLAREKALMKRMSRDHLDRLAAPLRKLLES